MLWPATCYRFVFRSTLSQLQNSMETTMKALILGAASSLAVSKWLIKYCDNQKINQMSLRLLESAALLSC